MTKRYLWTEIDYDDISTWPDDRNGVVVAKEDSCKPGWWRQSYATVWRMTDIKSIFNWKKVERIFFKGCTHFRPTHWRYLLDTDFPNDYYFEDKEVENKD